MLLNIHGIFQNEKNNRVTSLGPLRPDCSTIYSAEISEQPEAWLFHPTGITFQFDVKKPTNNIDCVIV